MAKKHNASMMGARGVTRPMAEMQANASPEDASPEDASPDQKPDDAQQDAQHEQHGHSAQDQHEHQHGMTHQDRLHALKMHHKHTLWIYWTLPLLGVWLLVAPFCFGYLNADLWVDPSGGRGPWFAAESTEALRQTRAWLMTASDVLCGVLLIVLGYRSLTPNRPKSLWACCFVGVWLTIAPVAFWAPTAAAYMNDSLVGILVMALTILIPGMPNMIMFMQHGNATPPGWSYNPSSWPQRWIMIVTGFAGFIVSRYLAMFQLGYIDYVWDPFFGFAEGTKQVLNSKMSHRWPVSDGGLGAIAYTFEFLMGYMGSPSRWRTMPWMVAFFGVLVIPLGLVHIVLIMSQPVIVHHWCSMCILAAMVMLPMLPLEIDEVVAMCQHVYQAKRRGDRNGSLWAIFWRGGDAEGCTQADPSPDIAEFPDQPWCVFKASIFGMSFPWTLVACSVLGILLAFFPSWFGIDIKTTAADIAHLGGTLIVTVSVVCMGEVVRAGRFLNLILALVIAVMPWLVDDSSTSYAVTCTAIAASVFLLTIPRGVVSQSYGGWNRYIV